MLPLRSVLCALSVCFLTIASITVYSQEYPTKPIRMYAGAAGANSDFIARYLAQAMYGPLGQTIVVENRGGGVPGDAVLNTPADGYTLFLGGSYLWTVPLLQKSAYDLERDFAPITLVAIEVGGIAVHPSVPVTSVKELIALAKAKPGQLNISSGVLGGTSQLAVENFKAISGVNVVPIPYKGGSAALAGLLGGEVHIMIYDYAVLKPAFKSGKIRVLAVTSLTPSPSAPDLPTATSAGLPGFESTGKTGLWAPAKTPTAIITRLNQEVVRALSPPETKAKFVDYGEDIIANSPEQFAAVIKTNTANVSKILKDLGVKTNN